MPELKQGAWTDIYTLAALVYLMITRKLPPPSVGRIVQDSYIPLTQCAAGRYSDTLLAGIDKCLAVRPENRPQNIPEMRALIGIHTKSSSSSKDAAVRSERKRSSKSRAVPKTWRQQLSENLVPTGAFLTALVALGGFAYYSGQRSVQSPVTPATTISAPVVATQSPVAVAPAAGDASKPAAEAKKPRQTATKPSNTKPKKSQEKSPTIVDAAKNVGKGVKSAAVGIAGWAKRTFGGGSSR
jgi:hypothetical protein